MTIFRFSATEFFAAIIMIRIVEGHGAGCWPAVRLL